MNIRCFVVLCFCLMIVGLVSSCAYKPILYPNDYYKKVGEAQANKDINAAINAADNTKDLDRNDYGKEALNTGISAGAGAGAGAAVGAISGSTGTGAIGGAMTGAIVSVVRWIFVCEEPTPAYKDYVDIYLRDKGYQVVGWK